MDNEDFLIIHYPLKIINFPQKGAVVREGGKENGRICKQPGNECDNAVRRNLRRNDSAGDRHGDSVQKFHHSRNQKNATLTESTAVYDKFAVQIGGGNYDSLRATRTIKEGVA